MALSPVAEITEQEFREIVNEQLELEKSASRQEYMLQKKKGLEEMLKHYTKIKDRWAKADVGIKIAGTVVIFVSSTLASVFSAGITLTASPVIAATLSGIAAVKTALTEGVMISLTTRRKKFYRKKCEIIKEYINKFYLFYEKCRDDNVVTLEEITKFNELLKMFNNELLSLKLQQNTRVASQLPQISEPKLTLKDYKKIHKEMKLEKIEQVKAELRANSAASNPTFTEK